MDKSKWRLIIILSAVILITGGFFLFRNGDVRNARGNAPRYKEISVKRGIFEIIVSASGVVKPIDRVEIKSKASGLVEELPIEQGDFVQKGQLIARLDQTDVRAEVEQAQADLDIAKAEVAQAQHIFNRRDRLFQQELISEEEKDQIALGLAQAKGQLVRARTALEQAQVRLSETTVRAPINGLILQKYVEEGQIIASGISNVSGGSPIADIADMNTVYIEAGIDEIDIGKVRVTQPATVATEAYPQLTFSGKIVRISPEARVEQNVTLFDVVIEVDNPEGKLKSGMNATVEISIVRKENVLLVPAMALQKMDDANNNPKVRQTLLKKESKFISHEVEIGLFDFKQAEIVAGLEEGDVVGVPMNSRLKAENERLEERIRSSRSFGASSQSPDSSAQRRQPQ